MMVALSIPRSISQQKREVGWGEHNGVTGRQWESHLSTGETQSPCRAATSSGYAGTQPINPAAALPMPGSLTLMI